MDGNASFGYWVRRRRKALDLTQAELARRVGCAEGTIRLIEADVRRPSRQIAERLADHLAIAPPDRSTFIQAARAELSVDRLGLPIQQTTHRHNLPAQTTRLIGRAQEVAWVTTALRTPDVRLLTLSGPGGVGKTRLALQAAAELLGDFPDGIFLVSLAPISTHTLVTGTIASTLGVRETAERPLRGHLIDYLHDKQMLLLLDNFEHLLEAAAVIADLLASAPHLKVLVTSRAVLQVYGEREFAVPPLALSAREQIVALDQLPQYPAVQLFMERAQAVKSDFTITEGNAPLVAEICRRLDGLPLAIELAAARVRLLPPQTLLARLEQRLPLLTGGARNLPARQQTMHATIDWSYQLLNVGEQTLFRRLAVFVGGSTIEAATAVCNPAVDLPLELLDAMAALIDQSLLRQEVGPDAESRFAMLELLQEYALEQLTVSGEAEQLREQHAQYYLALAECAEPLLHGTDQLTWLDRLEAEHANVRAALIWSQKAGRMETGLRLASALWWFWNVRGYLTEGREWLASMLAPEAEVPAQVRATGLNRTGFLAEAQGDHREAQALFEQARALSETVGDTLNRARALHGLGIGAFFQGDHQQAEVLYAASLALFRAAGALWDVSIVLHYFGWLKQRQADYQRAAVYLEESLALAQESDDRWGMATTLLLLGTTARYQGDYTGAQARYEASLAIFRQLGDKENIANALNAIGNLAWAQADYPRAAACYTESLALYQAIGDQAGVALSFCDLGYLVHDQGDDARAAVVWAEGLVRSRDLAEPGLIAYCLRGLGGVAVARGELERGARLLSAAEGLFETTGQVMNPIARAAHARDVAAAEAQLGEAAFRAASRAGRAMPLELAIAEALEGAA
jgi:predicted ATPase/transcriptional regulator with XRE-family HTH domain